MFNFRARGVVFGPTRCSSLMLPDPKLSFKWLTCRFLSPNSVLAVFRLFEAKTWSANNSCTSAEHTPTAAMILRRGAMRYDLSSVREWRCAASASPTAITASALFLRATPCWRLRTMCAIARNPLCIDVVIWAARCCAKHYERDELCQPRDVTLSIRSCRLSFLRLREINDLSPFLPGFLDSLPSPCGRTNNLT